MLDCPARSPERATHDLIVRVSDMKSERAGRLTAIVFGLGRNLLTRAEVDMMAWKREQGLGMELARRLLIAESGLQLQHGPTGKL